MKKLFICLALAAFAVLFRGPAAHAQAVGIKTNLVYDATLSPNLGLEVGLARRLSLEISGNLNLWNWKENTKWKHWMVQPELRLWTCQRFAGHFFALHGLVGQFNFGGISNNIKLLGTDFSVLTNERFEGWAFGGGLGYGYALPIGKHWNLEFELGLGAIYSIANGFECDVCNRPTESDIRKLRPALTKAAINLVYFF